MEGDRTILTSSDGIRDTVQRARPLHGRTSGPTRRSTKGQWTPEEDEILRQAVQRFKGKNWKKIAECFKDRTDVQCLHRWQKVLNPELVKGPWSKEEDEVIINLVNKYGPKKWSTIAQHLQGRIGKQCRERWHNHLNPAINKEAWTQEEELALIRAHQVYGNKWAELTKFLPGRTDNAIKNHWNSSVKKKLDQYLASGLLEQFQGLPHVSHPNHSNASSSSKVHQSSEDDSIRKDGAELEEISECSQGSAIVGCSQSASDMCNGLVHTRDESRVAEELSNKKDPSSSPCSENFMTSMQEATFPFPEAPHEFGSSSVLIDNNCTNEWNTSLGCHWQIDPNELSKMSSQDMGQESVRQFMQYLDGSESQQTESFPLQNFLSYTSMVVDGCVPSGIDMTGAEGSADPLLFQSSNYQICEDGSFTSQSGYSLSTDLLAASYSQQPSVPPQVPSHDDSNIFSVDPNQFNESIVGTQDKDLPERHGIFVSVNELGSSPGADGTKDQMAEANDASKLVAVSDICSAPSQDVQNSGDQDPIIHNDQKDSGALCYEPPRFPSLDIPFLSCDLMQSGTDMLLEFSPLGTRQFWTSINRLWDSPSGEKSPDAFLKNAAKSYTSTPSILKKRNRDLLSPLSERRSEKRFGSDLNHESFSNMTREFSRLDVMFDEVGNDNATKLSPSSNDNTDAKDFVEDKENINPDIGQGEMKDVNGVKRITDCRTKDEANCHKTEGQGNDAAEIVNQASGTLIEHDMNSLLFFSPERFGIKSDRTVGLSVRALGNQYTRRFEAASNAISSSSENLCVGVCSPRLFDKKDETNLVKPRSLQSASSLTPLVNKVGIQRSAVNTENISIFGETPYKRSIESPSAWKSPWFMNTFLPGSRVDTDLTIEDYGHFVSPGDKSYDAIGLMKQLSEQTASAFANAQEVLGDETPETLLKKKCSKNLKMDGQNNEISKCEPGQPSNDLGERRILDFSDCGTPRKGTETGKLSNAKNFPSPSSYLLKGCR